ncbi:MAG: HEPN domain-containing protein [Anaerolineales bacterium]
MSTLAIHSLDRADIETAIRDRILAARDDVAGIVLFGSFARNEEWQDVDVLVVLHTPFEPGLEWRARVRELRNAVSMPRAEIIVTDTTGLQRGLANHDFLLMDIAYDAIVLHGEAVRDTLASAREEIEASGIRRLPTGWHFPVEYRRSTPLSPTPNDVRAERWLADADDDLRAAASLLGAGIYSRSVFFSQLATEKAVKAVLLCFGRFDRTHYVSGTLREVIEREAVGTWADQLARLADHAEALEDHITRSRYVMEDAEGEEPWVPVEHYDQEAATEARERARGSLAIARDFTAWWFAPDAAGES